LLIGGIIIRSFVEKLWRIYELNKKQMKIKRFFLSGLVVMMSFFVMALPQDVAAEGDVVCSGVVSGISNLVDVNAGRIYFNSHPTLDDRTGSEVHLFNVPVVDFAIVNENQGIAPEYREHAACVEEQDTEDEFEIQGYSWNDNLGFISFFCEGGVNPEVDSNPNNEVGRVACGSYNYGVEIGPLVEGERLVTGYGWNEALGYIQFADDNPGDAIDYGVTVNASGNMSGYAWSESQVWVNFNGVKVDLPGQIEEEVADDGCGSDTGICVLVDPVLPGLTVDTFENMPVANGKDGYRIHVFLRDEFGDPIDPSDVEMNFVWEDTVRRNQQAATNPGTVNFSSMERPATSSAAAVLFKPVTINSTNFANYFEPYVPEGGDEVVWTFTTCGQTGRTGPSQGQCDTTYSGSTLDGSVTVAAGIQKWTVPYTGTYRIEGYGAQGGGVSGGLGAYMSGDFALTQGEVIDVIVGQQGLTQVGEPFSVGGGGGTFVVSDNALNNGDIFLVAGGGGGSPGTHSDNRHAGIGTAGNSGVGYTGGSAGGINGSGGSATVRSAGGGGFFTDGQANTQTPVYATGGLAFLNGGDGGTHSSTGVAGAFGGGGAAWQTGWRGSGGGGGYSGGGGAYVNTVSSLHSGGGGGSYNNGSNQINNPGVRSGDGAVVITTLDVEAGGGGTPEPGRYVLKDEWLVSSMAPTTNGNLSWTTSTEPSVPFKNSQFVNAIDDMVGKSVPDSKLTLNYVEFTIEGEPKPPVYANNRSNLELNFRPALYVDTLFADSFQDSILGTRGLPTNYDVKFHVDPDLVYYPHPSISYVDLYLDHSTAETVSDFAAGCTTQEAGNFLVKFLNNQFGADLSSGSTVTLRESYPFTTLQGGVVLNSRVELPSDPEDVSPCAYAVGPTFYTMVRYYVASSYYQYPDTGSVAAGYIYYYSNKLPRLTSKISNPAAFIQGNIYAPTAFSPNSEQAIQAVGRGEGGAFRNIVYNNMSIQLKGVSLDPTNEKGAVVCTVTNLDPGSLVVTGSGCEPPVFEEFELAGGDAAVIFKNVDVVIDLSQSAWNSSQTLVVLGGNIYIDSDLYQVDELVPLALISYGPSAIGCSDRGNIYIDSGVRNIQANLFADCSVFSYAEGSGEIAADGSFVWDSFASMKTALNKQLLIEGSVASYNTIGGADTDTLGYLRNGFGQLYRLPVSQADRVKAQSFDLNYLRLFGLKLAFTANGLPIDQQCGKGLAVEEIQQINAYNQCIAEFFSVPYCEAEVGSVQGPLGECNGINAKASVFDDEPGDLVVPSGESLMAEGVDPEKDFEPIHIYYVPAVSSLFQK
jgi:hypothetical protein